MKQHIRQLVFKAIEALQEDGQLDADTAPEIQIERTRDASHGEYACNVAMMLAKQARCNPRALAEKIVNAIPDSKDIAKKEIAGPGFINFYLTDFAVESVVGKVFQEKESFGESQIGAGHRILIEFVSANPTGPLHVGHGRGAAYGAALANLLAAADYDVEREYYVNDAGRQMDILAISVWLRYLELCGESITFPSNGYKGDYVFDIAATVHRQNGDRFQHLASAVYDGVPVDLTEENPKGDKEAHIDALIARAKELLDDDCYRMIFDAGLNTIVEDIRHDLEGFGVHFDDWFSERSLTETGIVEETIAALKNNNYLYEKDGNWWFKSSELGDEKDRVVVRKNGSTTYLASDIAYHLNKLKRGYDHLIDIWGADHHGYIARIKAAIEALGEEPSKLEILMVQFAILYRGKDRLQMSTRSGEFVRLRELRQEVGNDAARFYYVLRKCEQHLDFDLELAKSSSNDNPVYYVQYAHARICSVIRQLKEKGISIDETMGLANVTLLTENHERSLLNKLSRYPEIVESAAQGHEPHQLAHFLRELANDFHSYYNAHQFIVDEEIMRNTRIVLILAIKQVFVNCLKILGVSAPETM